METQGGDRKNIRFLQTNGNHCRAAYDLLYQYVREMEIGICCVAEPWDIREDPCWFGSWNGLAAIYWNPDVLKETCFRVHVARDFVIIRCGRLYVASVYISPSVSTETFVEITDELGEQLRNVEGEVIVCGDFNAKSRLWGSVVVNRCGNLLEDWAATYNLNLANVGNAPTCIRPQGTSIVDTTWSSLHENSNLVSWRTLDIETLSDHVYITFEYQRAIIAEGLMMCNQRTMRKKYPRWGIKDMDVDLFREVLEFHAGAF